MKVSEKIGYGVLAAFVALLLWLLSRKDITHAATPVVTSQTFGIDTATGAPQFNSSNPASVPSGTPINPIDASNGAVTPYAVNPTCPAGYQLYKDAGTGAYYCYPVS